MKSPLGIIAICSILPLIAFGEGKLYELDEQFLQGLDEVKKEYRAGLNELLEQITYITLYQIGPAEKKEGKALDPFSSREGYWGLGQFEYEIREAKKIAGDDLELWKSGLSSLLVPAGQECWVAMHQRNTVLSAYGEGIDPLFEESQIFTITFSWEYNNYLIRYPYLGMDRHAIVGTELKKLIMKEFPHGSYEVSPQVRELLNEPNQSEDHNSE